jgi:FixJ family two-component response regulator
MNNQPNVLLVDDDPTLQESLILLMETFGFAVQTFNSAEDFLKRYCPEKPGCLILDIKMPGMTGPELQIELARRKIKLPIIFLTAYGDIPLSVKTIKAGAIDFLTKPVQGKLLIELIKSALQEWGASCRQEKMEKPSCLSTVHLTRREEEVMSLAVSGHTNKEIARCLGISHRTVEIHRSRVMEKTGATNLLELAHLCEREKSSPQHENSTLPSESSDTEELSRRAGEL